MNEEFIKDLEYIQKECEIAKTVLKHNTYDAKRIGQVQYFLQNIKKRLDKRLNV
jgi:hypothetical protein